MANISLTQRCNRSCSYCFAQDVMRVTDPGGAFMSLGDFSHALEFAQRSGVEEVKLLGGEPTIHPAFAEMVEMAHELGLRVLVLSGGLVPERALAHLERAARDRVCMMMNVIPPDAFTPRERERQAAVMARLRSKVVLGLNIDSPSTPLDFLLDFVSRYDLQRALRLGLTHPIVGAESAYLRAQDYPAVGRRVADFFWRAKDASIRIDFDCGWVPCMFPEGFMERAGLTPDEIGLRCNPIIDVLPGRRAIACYPLASIAVEQLTDEVDGHVLSQRFVDRLTPYRPLKLYKHCDTCAWYQRGTCTGGCIAGAMTRLRAPHAAA